MKFKMYLQEVFDNPYKYKVQDDSYGLVGKFYDEQGAFFQINFDFESYEMFPSRFHGDQEQKLENSVALKEPHDYDVTEIMFDKDGRYEMTKSNAFRVFATFKAILKDSKSKIKKSGGDIMIFEGKTSDKGRIKFYKTLLLYIKKELGYKYTSIYNNRRGDNLVFLAYNNKDIQDALK